MKTPTRAASILAISIALLTAQSAFAFYNPQLGRWANRDPLGETGFETTRGRTSDVIGGGFNAYAFVANNPSSLFDSLGLAIWKCSRQTEWQVPGLQHTYLWDDRPGTTSPRSCGRDGAGWPLLGKAWGRSNTRDKGPGVDRCKKIPNSDGKEPNVMACCRTPKYKPFPFYDCHDWSKNCLTSNGLEDPAIYGKWMPPTYQLVIDELENTDE
jgi:RHS repeat-associated protein